MSKQSNGWFEVDKSGFAQLMTRRGAHVLVTEPIANAFDQNVSYVSVLLEVLPGQPLARLVVEDDDPNGFEDLAHAYTMFRDTTKRKDPSKRGRFNLGEKAILSICTEAQIITTTGTVQFDENGRHKSRAKRDAGSVFDGTVRMTREDVSAAEALIRQLIPPAGVRFTFNGEEIRTREPLTTIRETLPTEAPDKEGYLRRTARKTDIFVYEPGPGETSMLYELGIPVVELPDHPWHVDVQQRVPLNVERDNVTPAFKKTINVLLLNNLHDKIDDDHAGSVWAREAAGDKRVEQKALSKVLDLRFGKDRVSFDPSDPEANKLAASQGMTVVTGGSLTKDEWAQVKRHESLQPAGKVTPSPRVTMAGLDGLSDYLPDEKLSEAMLRVREYVVELAPRLMRCEVAVHFVNKPTIRHDAFYGQRAFTFNIASLGRKWFEGTPGEKLNDLVIHEFGHEYASDHLSSDYYHALTKLGARLAAEALRDPGFFAKHGFSIAAPEPA